jgi:hypothetical protein
LREHGNKNLNLNISLTSVVTGVRFVEIKNVYFLQLQTGQVMADGLVDSGTVNWLELPFFDEIDEKNTVTFKYSKYFRPHTYYKNRKTLENCNVDNTEIIVKADDEYVMTGKILFQL